MRQIPKENKHCKKCNGIIKRTTIIDGKEYFSARRMYCYECSPLFSRNSYNLRKEETRLKNSEKIINGYTRTCKCCGFDFSYNTDKSMKTNVCTTCKSFAIRHRNKKICIKELGNCCVGCGISDPDVLTFHHKNPDDKSFTISHSLHLSLEKLLCEIKKCELLCMNCHMKKHKKEDEERKTKVLEFFGVDWFV